MMTVNTFLQAAVALTGQTIPGSIDDPVWLDTFFAEVSKHTGLRYTSGMWQDEDFAVLFFSSVVSVIGLTVDTASQEAFVEYIQEIANPDEGGD